MKPVRARPADPAIARLSDEERRFVADSCVRRAGLELLGGAAFTMVTQALFDLGAETDVVALSARAIDEELHHSTRYLELAAAYAGAPVTAPRAGPIRPPRHAGVSPTMQAALRVVGMCAVNETMACGFLELCRDGATGEMVRAALHDILSDEIRHAQIGWAFLGSARLDAADRAAISSWLPTLLDDQWAGWRGQIAVLPARAMPAHGCPSPAAIERAAMASIAELVLPGLAHVGLDVRAATAWFDGLGAAHPGARAPA